MDDEVNKPKGPPTRRCGPEGPKTSCVMYHDDYDDQIYDEDDDDGDDDENQMTQYSEPEKVGSAKHDGSDSFPLHNPDPPTRFAHHHDDDDEDDDEDDHDDLVGTMPLLHQLVCDDSLLDNDDNFDNVYDNNDDNDDDDYVRTLECSISQSVYNGSLLGNDNNNDNNNNHNDGNDDEYVRTHTRLPLLLHQPVCLLSLIHI